MILISFSTSSWWSGGERNFQTTSCWITSGSKINHVPLQMINGYQINPNTRIHDNVWAIGRDPNLWKNPEEFLFERFIENSIDFRGQHFELLPFGAGRRVCPASYMGSAEVLLFIKSLLFSFTLLDILNP